MKAEKDKFAVISEIYSHFTEKNKEYLLKTAVNLLEVQKKDAEMLNPSKNENESKVKV